MNKQEPPVDDPAVDNLQDDDPLGALLQEVRHLLLELRLHLVLGNHLQVVPRGLAAPLHLTQVLLQLVEIHLSGRRNVTIVRFDSSLSLSLFFK